MLKLCSFWIYKSGGKWRKKRDDKKIDFHYGKKQKFKFHIQSKNIKILNCYDFFEGLLLSISDKFHFLNFIQSGLQNQLPAFLFSSKWKRRGGGGKGRNLAWKQDSFYSLLSSASFILHCKKLILLEAETKE